MKKMIGFLLCGVVMLSACGKKKEVKIEKKSSSVLAQNVNRSSFDEYVFDEKLSNIEEELAFLDLDLGREEAYLELNDEVSAFAQIDSVGINSDTSIEWNDSEVGLFIPLRFGFDSDMLLKGQEDVIAANIEAAKQAIEDGGKIIISAYACQIGTEDYNLALTQYRANQVKKMFVKAGIPANLIETKGEGQCNFIVTTDETERLRKIDVLAVNRRAEISSRFNEASV